MKQDISIKGIMKQFQGLQVEAKGLAAQWKSGWVVCFKDGTPFRHEAASGRIQVMGENIVITNVDGARNLAAKLDKLAKKNMGGSERSEVVAMKVTEWAAERVVYLQSVIDQCKASLKKGAN